MIGGVSSQEATFDALVATIKAIRSEPSRASELVSLLRETASVYAGKGATEAERLRGFILASFEPIGLPDVAMPYVLEELETGTNAYTVAAAACAVRGAMSPPDKIIPLLIGAIERVQRFDDYVDFTGYESPRKATGNTAVAELLRTLAGAGPRGLDAVRMLRRRPDVKERFSAAAIALMDAVDSKVAAPGHCCSGGTNSEVCESINLDRDALTHLWDIELQDQDGNRASCRYFFEDRVSLMSFFYTRCMNPNKCSSTVSKLASIGRRIAEEGKVGNVVVAGITYDPDFDSPERLHRYGVDRGMTFGDHCRLLRTTGPFEALRQPLDLQVGFGSSTVNRHALDVLVVDRTGRITHAITRRLWAEAEVYERLMAAATSA